MTALAFDPPGYIDTIKIPAQLDLWGEDSTVLSRVVPGVGHVLITPGQSWRARWSGRRYGWLFERAITWEDVVWDWLGRRWSWEPRLVARTEWESWEPDLPYGVEHVLDRGTAVEILEGFMHLHGDDPGWLSRMGR